jgi:dipeptidase D
LRHAIARSGTATIVVESDHVAAVKAAVESMGSTIARELKDADPDVVIAVVDDNAPASAVTVADTTRIAQVLVACPHGAFAMIPGMHEVTETSNNLAIVELSDGKLHVRCMFRSSVESKKQMVGRWLTNVFSLVGASCEVANGYPGWQPNTSSPVLAMLRALYEQKFSTKAKVTATHGGLECGLICSTYPNIDAVSIGPTIRFPHSPDEQVDIASVQRFWSFFVDVLAQIPASA